MKESCVTIALMQKIIGGKWKILIIWHLKDGVLRFSQLNRLLNDITQSTLTKQLRELEADGFISRYVYQEIPPKVEYSLTETGRSFISVLENMRDWGEKHLGGCIEEPAGQVADV